MYNINYYDNNYDQQSLVITLNIRYKDVLINIILYLINCNEILYNIILLFIYMFLSITYIRIVIIKLIIILLILDFTSYLSLKKFEVND